ncbi:MAG TPA: hypothetical protein VJX67_11135, partial [Blastocatellia bacterium]|nr:hypothetical protein [Blastocatellia bacterium]
MNGQRIGCYQHSNFAVTDVISECDMTSAALSSDAMRTNRPSEIVRIAEIFGSEWIMVFFYGDESGSNGTGDYVLSGYLAHKSTWDLFSANWNRFLTTSLPIKYLKMSQWEHRDSSKKHGGQFIGMNDLDADARLDSLVALMCTMLQTGAIGEYTVSISWDLYRRSINGACKQVFDDPYYVLMMHVVKMAMHGLRIKSPSFKGKIHFVFDAGNSAERHSQRHFYLLKK